MRKVLIISYYWPPIGGSGVQRWLKMSRYLVDKGWLPMIFTPENPSFGIEDESLLKEVHPDIEVIRFPIWEPYGIFSKLKGKGGKISASDISIKSRDTFFDKLMFWVRANFFVPDPRVFWVKPAVKFLPDIINLNDIDVVITTGPPHSLHFIGLKLKKLIPVKWVADFRDPWTQWDLYEEFPMLPWVRKRHFKLERKVLKNADKIFTINNYYRKSFEELGGRKVEVITNGYDPRDFKNYNIRKNDVFTIRYIGIIDELRDPTTFTEALKVFLENNPEIKIKIEFIGKVTEGFKQQIQSNPHLSKITEFPGYLPHDEIIEKYKETAVLLLILTRSKHAAGNTTGKIFEYMASGARILALGPKQGEVADLLDKTNTGYIVEHEDIDGIVRLLEKYYTEYIHNMYPETKDVDEYSRAGQAKKVARSLDQLFN